jgi:hypothetical protein
MMGRLKKKFPRDYYPLDEKRYRELRRRHVIRLSMTYLAPFAILTAYLYIQYEPLIQRAGVYT